MRKGGYYWVQLCAELSVEVAHYIAKGENWIRVGDHKHYADVDFIQINEEMILCPPLSLPPTKFTVIQSTIREFKNLSNPKNP